MKLKLLLSAVFAHCILFAFAQQSKNERKALEYIQSEAKNLEINPQHSFKLSFVHNGPAGEVLRFQQMLNGVPVLNSEIVVNFSPQDELVYSSNSYNKAVQIIDVKPNILSEQAITLAKNALKFNESYNFQESKLWVYTYLAQTKLVYKVNVQNNDNPGDWEVFIDAKTSEIISIKDAAIYHHKKEKKSENAKLEKQQKNKKATPLAFVTGTAMVFASDPLGANRSTYGGQYVDGSDATNASLDAARISVNLPEIDLTAGVYRLKSTYCDILDFESPNKGLFTQNTNAFNFTRDSDAFEAANSFYHLDNSIRYINTTLGITCRPQQNAGVLIYDPSGLSAADNSHFIPSSDRIAFGEGCVDDAEDADVVWHELGHGLHDWMTNGNANSAEGLGEGSGDYWAQSHSRSLNQWLSTDAAYHYMFNWDGHNTCWTGRVTNVGTNYPTLSGSIHTDGQIWATALMKIWDVIGRTKTDKAFLSGLALTNSTSTQNQAAIAVRQAGINMNYSCADIKTMTEQFTSKGYTMPAVALKINCPATQTVNADASGNYTVPSFSNLSNAISPNCDAVLSQSPAIGAVVTAGTHPVTMTATSGGTATCNFNLVVNPYLSTEDFNRKYVSIYPNPASSEIIIKGDIFENENMTIYNMLGQKVMQQTINSDEEKVNINNLSAGVYTIFFNKGKASYKFVKK